jgi:hypothetical protein
MPRPESRQPTASNPLSEQEPELVPQLNDFRLHVNDMLLDKLAAAQFNDPAFRMRGCPYPLADVKASAQILRVLTRKLWDADDLAIFDACWRQATHSDLFGDEFESERHRIQHAVDAIRQQLCPSKRSAGLR